MNSKSIFGPTNPSSDQQLGKTIKRFGAINRLHPEKEALYRKLHADVWPSILARLKMSNMQNYSIYLHEIDGAKMLFSYLEYTGTDFEGDMQAVANDPETKRWWEITDPCQNPLPSDTPGSNWIDMEMIFLME